MQTSQFVAKLQGIVDLFSRTPKRSSFWLRALKVQTTGIFSNTHATETAIPVVRISIGLDMGPNNLCCVIRIRILLSNVTFYNIFCICIYITIIVYKTFLSIFIFCKISTSILQFLLDFDVTFYSFYQGSCRILQLLKWLCRTSFFYPCGALSMIPY